MSDRMMAWRVGIVVLTAAIITLFLVIMLGEGRALWQDRYTIHLNFPQAPGVMVDTPVRKHGVLVGRVTNVELRDEGGVMVTARIDGNRKLYSDETCRITSSILGGDAVIEFVPASVPDPQRKPVLDNEVINNVAVGSDPIRMLTNLEGDVRRAVTSFESAANNVDLLAQRLNKTFGTNDDQLQRIMQKSELALDRMQSTMATVDEFIGDPQMRESLKVALRELPVTFGELRTTMQHARDTLDGFQNVGKRAETNLANLEKFTKPLGERGDEIVNNISGIVENVELMSSEVADLAQRIKGSDGSIAKLIRDDELYVKITEVIENVQEASRRLRPIMEDVRVFSDKIATDPRVLGVKGGLDNRPLGVGIK